MSRITAAAAAAEEEEVQDYEVDHLPNKLNLVLSVSPGPEGYTAA